MKRLKAQNGSEALREDRINSLCLPGLLRKSLPGASLVAAMVLCFPLNIVHAQSLYPDNGNKNIFPHTKNINSYPAGFTKLFDFNSAESGSVTEEIIRSDCWLYCLNYSGGAKDFGLIFITKTDGSGISKIAFDGAHPNALVISGSVLYGATRSGGTFNAGVLYKTSTDGSGFAILYNFRQTYNYPVYNLIVSGNVIYGQVFESLAGYGYIFKINTDGTGFTKLSDISAFPFADLLLSDNYLYGITWGSIYESGQIFKIKTDGTDFVTLHTFYDSSEGLQAYNSLTLVGNTLFGTTTSGGTSNGGTLFKINTDGTGFQKLYDFSSSDGTNVRSALILSGSFLFGTANNGGSADMGTIFRFNKDGSGFNKQYDFQDAANGLAPQKIVMWGDTIFGYANGGVYNSGILYRFTVNNSLIGSKNQLKTVTLALKRPEHPDISTKDGLSVEKGKYIDLDTTFTVTGNVQYTHTWKVKTNTGYEMINKTAKITNDSTFYIFITTIDGCSYFDSTRVVAKAATGVFDTESGAGLCIYPNPNDGNFQINIPSGYGDCSYEIFNIQGAKITTGNIFCASDDCIHSIRLPDIKPGAYTLAIMKRNLLLCKVKFIISK